MALSNISVEDVLRTAEIAFKEYQNVTQRLTNDAEVLSALPILSWAINSVKDRLESAIDDEDFSERLEDIFVNQKLFLPALNGDLSTICTYLQGVGTPGKSSKDEVDTYAQALNRYSDVLKVVQNRKMRYVIRLFYVLVESQLMGMIISDRMNHIDAGLILLNEAIATMHSQLARTGHPSDDDLFSEFFGYGPNHDLFNFAPALDYLERLRPLHSALHDSQGAPQPYGEGIHQDTIEGIFRWLNTSSSLQSHEMVCCLYGDNRSVTSAIAQRVARRAQEENQLLSSFFFAWSGNEEGRKSANLIPTMIYQLAQWDSLCRHKIAMAIKANRDVRDKDASIQISLLLKKPFKDENSFVTSGLRPVVVIDALDVCSELDRSKVAQDIGLFIQALAQLRIKVFITSRFPQAIKDIVTRDGFSQFQLVVQHGSMMETSMISYPDVSDIDIGKLQLYLLK